MERDNNEMEQVYAETFRQVRRGAIVTGRIISVKQDGVIVDIGYKSEGFIPADDFTPAELRSLAEGDAIEAYVSEMRDAEGMVVLSKQRATQVQAWGSLESAIEQGALVDGTITGKTKGGLTVDVMGVKAFLPGSQIDVKPVRDPDSLLGKTMQFRVLKMSNRRTNIIVSRRAVVEEERDRRRAETLPKLKEGALVEGVVKNITDYGVFVDLGGIDGLLHISDISWGRIAHPSEAFTVGDAVEVLILKYDRENQRINLGYKQKMPDPWLSADERYPVGRQVSGKVVSITDYGAFIELEGGVEGLVHISEIDWSPRPKHPAKYVSVGQPVEAVVIKVDKNDRRLSLSLKQLKASPWQLISEHYAPGHRVSGKIRSLTDFGAFVGLPEGVDGLIHISDMSWTRHVKHPSELLKKGQKVEAVILSLEPEKERISLGLKQLTEDPWLQEIPEKYRLGTEVRCRILKMTDFGIFAEIDGSLEGLIYSSEIVRRPEPFQEGDVITARIIKIDTEERKIGLSMKNVKGEAPA